MSVRAVVRRGKKLWRVHVIRDKGKFNRRRFLDRRVYLKSDALEVEKALIAEFERSRETSTCMSTKSGGQFGPQVMTFAAFAERYLQLQNKTKPDFRNKRRNVNLHLVPYFGATPLNDVSTMMIDEFRTHLREQPKARSRREGGERRPKTINNILATLSGILNLAYEYDLLARMPKVKRERVPKDDPVYLDFDECERLLKATPEDWRPLVETAILTGMRRGELIELRWGDLHFEARQPYVRVQRSVSLGPNGEIQVKETKGGRARSVPMCERLVRVLRESRPVKVRRDRLVFTEEDGQRVDLERMYNVVVPAGQAAKLEKRVRPHVLRHKFASRAYLRGVPPQVVQMWLGHADLGTTQRYAHLAVGAGDGWIAGFGENPAKK